jgi:hypothetical protein
MCQKILSQSKEDCMQTRSIVNLVCILLSAVLLTGCAGVHKQAFNKEDSQGIKTIGIIEPAQPEKYAVHNIGHAGMYFGLIGGLIAAADMNSKTDQFTELMKARGFNITEEFQKVLVEELKKAGYSIKLIKVRRENVAFLESYEALDTEADVYLDSIVSAGYLCASGGSDYIPAVRSGVRMVKRGSGEILYQDVIAYGYEARRSEAVCIAAPQEYYFKNFEALSSSPDRALEGLRTGIPLLAKRIAQDLAK